MKKIITTLMLAAVMAVILPVAAAAQTYTTRRVYQNGRWQTVRVYTRTNRGNRYAYGNRNRYGRITPQEQRRLYRQRNRIYNLQNRINRDGVVTGREYRKLDKRADKYNRKVVRARNN